MIGFIQFNKPSIGYQGTLTLKPLTDYARFVGIIDQPIKDKNDCEQSRFCLKVAREMGYYRGNCEFLPFHHLILTFSCYL